MAVQLPTELNRVERGRIGCDFAIGVLGQRVFIATQMGAQPTRNNGENKAESGRVHGIAVCAGPMTLCNWRVRGKHPVEHTLVSKWTE